MRYIMTSLSDAIKQALRVKPKLAIRIIFLMIASSCAVPLIGLGQKWVLDSTAEHNPTLLAISVALSILAYCGAAVLQRLQQNLQFSIMDPIDESLRLRLLEAVSRRPTIDGFDDPDYLDRVEAVKVKSYSAAQTGWNAIQGIFTIAGALLSVAVLVTVSPIVAFLPVLAVVPVVTSMISAPKVGRAIKEAASFDRAALRYHGLATRVDTLSELKTSSASTVISTRADALWESGTRTQLASRIRGDSLTMLGSAVFGLGLILAISFTANGAGSAGNVILVAAIGLRLRGQASATVSAATGVAEGISLTRTLEAVVSRPLDGAPQSQGTAGRTSGLVCSDVSFSYARGRRNALKNLSISIPPGGSLAIVGANGSGKSTLLKLLAGMYMPDSGRITIDGSPIEPGMSSADRTIISACYQDFLKPAFSLREAVTFGLRGVDDTDVLDALAKAKLQVGGQRMPGLDAELGLEFGGLDLSHGQWQRVALARAVLRQSSLIFLFDEPTASVDAATENDLIEALLENSLTGAGRNRSVTVLVSHRYATAHLADNILVLDKGEAAELGSHEELLARGGLYADAFNAQRDAYQSQS